MLRWYVLILILGLPLNSLAGPLELDWFRAYATEKKIGKLKEGSIRVLYMGQGAVDQAIEIDLETGAIIVWPSVHSDDPPIRGKLALNRQLRLKRCLVEKDLEAIPFHEERLVLGGTAYLLEYRHENGYFYRVAREPQNGYFRSLVELVDAMAAPIVERERQRRAREHTE